MLEYTYIENSSGNLEQQDQYSLPFSEVTVGGIRCLELLSDRSKDAVKTKQRKKEKNTIGSIDLEIKFLDCKTGDTGLKEYNDIIIYSDRISLWDETTAKFYDAKGFTVDSQDLQGGVPRYILTLC